MRAITLACFGLLLTTPLAAQQRATPIWGFISLGAAGIADSGFYASTIGIAVELPRVFILGRVTGLDTPKKKRLQDAGVIVGIAPRRGIVQFGVGAGLGVVSDTRDSSTIAVPLEGFVTVQPVRWVGIGARVFGNINALANFGGVSVMLQLGRVRP